MKEIEPLDYITINGQKYRQSLFECPVCNKHTTKIRKDGLKAKACSHKCSRTGNKRGPYTEKVFISGYYYIQHPDHPRATKKGYIAEHRFIAEQKIGRFLSDDEVVHHINENKLDNRPENLQVMTVSEHMSLHAEIKRRNGNGQFTI